MQENKKTPLANYGEPKAGQGWFGQYFEAFKNSLIRAWRWKFLWFWGIFLPAAGSRMNFNLPGGDGFGEEGELEALGEKAAFLWQQNKEIIIVSIIVALLVVILISIFFWMLGAVARIGTAKALSEIQEKGEPKTFNFRQVWRKGKEGLGSMLALDLLFAIFHLLIFAVIVGVAFLIFGGFFYGSDGLSGGGDLIAVFLGVGVFLVVLAIILIPLLIVLGNVKLIAMVGIALYREKAGEALINGWRKFKGNFKEFLKLFLINIIFGFFLMMVALVLILPLTIFGLFAGIVLFGMGGGVILVPIMVVMVVIVFAIGILVKAFLAIWRWDISVWWVKKISGTKSPGKVVVRKAAVRKVATQKVASRKAATRKVSASRVTAKKKSSSKVVAGKKSAPKASTQKLAVKKTSTRKAVKRKPVRKKKVSASSKSTPTARKISSKKK